MSPSGCDFCMPLGPKLLKGAYIEDYIGEYCKGYMLRGVLGVQTMAQAAVMLGGFFLI